MEVTLRNVQNYQPVKLAKQVCRDNHFLQLDNYDKSGILKYHKIICVYSRVLLTPVC